MKMAALSITGDNLGERHRSFNAIVNKAITDKQPFEATLTEDEDLNNLLKIDLASANRNVDFILEVYKSEDMLYVSRALKRTTWLITDSKYAHIIQTNFLYNDLFPQMTTKAVNKLLLSIKLNLKDEARVEEFYNYIKVQDKNTALKWLPKCSVHFIENEVSQNEDQEIPYHIVKRLIERSFTVFVILIKQRRYYSKHTNFLALQNTEKYMDLLETMDYTWHWNLSSNLKQRLIKKFPDRIFNKIEKYYHNIDLNLLTKFARERPDLREILIKNATDNKGNDYFRQGNIRQWITLLPKENRFETIKKYIIMREEIVSDDGLLLLCVKGVQNQDSIYEMYEYAPFDIAFEDLKKLIRSESTPAVRNAMLLVLLSTAKGDMKNLRKLLQYYYEKHVNTPFKFKIEFINDFLSQIDTHAFDDDTWEILNKLFQSSEVYMNSDNNVRHCVDAIIVRSLIRGVEIPITIQSKFVFSTLKSYEKKIKNQSEKNVVFNYLYNYINKDIKIDEMSTEDDFSKCLSSVNKLLQILNDWNKNVNEFPDIHRYIGKLIEINKKNNYEANLSTIYNKNREFRRNMFEESIVLAPSDEVLVNVIKHDAKMLDHYKDDIISILSNECITLKQLLRKVRVYWPDSIAKEFKTLYKEQIENKGNKALVSGFCTLVTHKELQAFIKKYSPTETKIDWNETDERVYNLRKHIAKALYKARPLVPIDFILLYAKGDYLQYTVPSLCAVLSQLSAIKCGKCISKLLDAPVSLQKYGIRYPFMKLSTRHLIPLALEIWGSSKNPSIRLVLVSSVHTRLCQEREESKIMEIWNLFKKIIDNLNCDENKNIYEVLTNVKNIPHIIKPEYLIKVYKFLDSLPPKVRCKPQKDKMKSIHLPEVMESLDDDFVIDFLLKDIMKTIKSDKRVPDSDKHVLAAFILCNKDEDVQIRRYKKFLAPLLDSCISEWTVPSAKTSVRTQTQWLLTYITEQFKNMSVEKKMNIPYKVFSSIQSQLENGLSYEKNYIFLTNWKLTVEVVRIFYEFKQDLLSEVEEDDKKSQILCSALGKFCARTLKEDLKKFYSSVYILFTKALKEFKEEYKYVFELNYIELYKCIMENSQEFEIYMVVYSLLESEIKHYYEVDIPHLKEIQKMSLAHPSGELKMHYYNLFTRDLEETD